MVTYFVAFVVEGLEAKSLSTTLGDDWTPPSWHSRNWHRLRLGGSFVEKKKHIPTTCGKGGSFFFRWGGKVVVVGLFSKRNVGFKRDTPGSLRPSIYKVGWFSWMIPKHYIKNGGFTTKHPSIKTWLFRVFQEQAWCFWWVFVPLFDISTSPTRAGSLQGGR